MERSINYYKNLAHNPEDPLPTHALFLDQSTPIDPDAKVAFLAGLDSKCRQFFLPVVRPFAKCAIVLNQTIKIVIPNALAFPKLMHYLIYLGLKFFASPGANLLIMRHFHLGSEILQFVRDNTKGIDFPLNPLKPKTINEVNNNLFVQHDINIFNFVINYNKALNEKGITPQPIDTLNFDAITDGPCDMQEFKKSMFNILDVETAIEIYTPIFQFFLTDNDFWRASNSLQLDETIGIYVSQLLGNPTHLWRVNNKHPLLPLTTFRAGYRLLLHGMASENLHYLLRLMKREQQKTT